MKRKFLVLYILSLFQFGIFAQTAGEKLFKENKPSEAAKQLEIEISKNQINSNTFNFLGLCYYQPGDYEKAVEVFEKGLEVKISNKKVLALNLGNAYFSLKNMEKARDSFSLALTFDENYAQAMLNRANCDVALGRYADAVRDYEKYIFLEPESKQKDKINSLVKLLKEEIKKQEELAKLEAMKDTQQVSSNDLYKEEKIETPVEEKEYELVTESYKEPVKKIEVPEEKKYELVSDTYEEPKVEKKQEVRKEPLVITKTEEIVFESISDEIEMDLQEFQLSDNQLIAKQKVEEELEIDLPFEGFVDGESEVEEDLQLQEVLAAEKALAIAQAKEKAKAEEKARFEKRMKEEQEAVAKAEAERLEKMKAEASIAEKARLEEEVKAAKEAMAAEKAKFDAEMKAAQENAAAEKARLEEEKIKAQNDKRIAELTNKTQFNFTANVLNTKGTEGEKAVQFTAKIPEKEKVDNWKIEIQTNDENRQGTNPIRTFQGKNVDEINEIIWDGSNQYGKSDLGEHSASLDVKYKDGTEILKETAMDLKVISEAPKVAKKVEVKTNDDGSVDINIPTLSFKANSYELTETKSNNDTILKVYEILKDNKYKDYSVVITGFINPDGAEWTSEEKALAFGRAQSVVTKLVSLGISPSRLVAEYGSGKTTNKEYNRRVEFKLKK